ncbi:hypothetical protein [Emticicia soli]|uniref:DUF4377 domain-containing protein n=1 Tax=Emticicia soli TaxID=2027878 RepID=A0ABW5J486_9BACT
MRDFIKILLVVCASPIMLVSCRNEVAALDEISEAQKAIVVFEGDPAVDGCGWLLSVKDKFYYPVNLSSQYQVDSLEVTVKYEIQSTKWTCGWRSPGYEKIEIKEIRKL